MYVYVHKCGRAIILVPGQATGGRCPGQRVSTWFNPFCERQSELCHSCYVWGWINSSCDILQTPSRFYKTIWSLLYNINGHDYVTQSNFHCHLVPLPPPSPSQPHRLPTTREERVSLRPHHSSVSGRQSFRCLVLTLFSNMRVTATAYQNKSCTICTYNFKF